MPGPRGRVSPVGPDAAPRENRRWLTGPVTRPIHVTDTDTVHYPRPASSCRLLACVTSPPDAQPSYVAARQPPCPHSRALQPGSRRRWTGAQWHPQEVDRCTQTETAAFKCHDSPSTSTSCLRFFNSPCSPICTSSSSFANHIPSTSPAGSHDCCLGRFFLLFFLYRWQLPLPSAALVPQTEHVHRRLSRRQSTAIRRHLVKLWCSGRRAHHLPLPSSLTFFSLPPPSWFSSMKSACYMEVQGHEGQGGGRRRQDGWEPGGS